MIQASLALAEFQGLAALVFLGIVDIQDIAVLADSQVIADLESQVFLDILDLVFQDTQVIQDLVYLDFLAHLGLVEFQVILV